MDVYLIVIGTLLAAVCIWKIFGIVNRYKEAIRLYSHKEIQSIGKFHPIWGHLHLISNFDDFTDICFELVKETKTRIVSFWIMFFFPLFAICHPETAKIVLKSSEPKSKGPGGAYYPLMDWLGDGLLISDGKKWERNRRLLTPAFHFDVLKPYVSIYNKVFDIFLDKLEKATSGGNSVEVYDPIGLATLDTMLRCSVSYDERVQEQGSNHPYVDAMKKLTHISQERLLRPWLTWDFVFYLSPLGREFSRHTKYVHDFDEKVIRERRASLAADPSVLKKRHLDFLDILLTARDEQGTGLTDREVRDEVDTFLFEGHDTTASSIGWAVYSLAKYPEEQQKVYEEVTKVLGGRQNVEWSDIQELSRLSLFIKESMRMFSPVPGIARVTTKKMELDGVTLPVNTEVTIMIQVLNHHEEIWKKPQEFRPDRFVDESNRDPYSYVPFSAGPRNCIGQHFAMNEQKVALAKLIQRFRILPDPNNIPVPTNGVVTRSKNGIYVKLEKR
ncbi:cytochrome P450 4A24-like [Ylistrum balloti]|uniref:cytochrome P450 4A24-like n=1 Tax=Ylistrum balloti TaxID=509963 RepID=UPI002905E7D9|nr:cytochrome P450 4A24-like [Ylistrum balloti]